LIVKKGTMRGTTVQVRASRSIRFLEPQFRAEDGGRSADPVEQKNLLSNSGFRGCAFGGDLPWAVLPGMGDKLMGFAEEHKRERVVYKLVGSNVNLLELQWLHRFIRSGVDIIGSDAAKNTCTNGLVPSCLH
jgi:hypothetical protein